MIDRHSQAIELKMPLDSVWEVTPLVSPAQVCKGHAICTYMYMYVNLGLHCSQINMDVVSDYQPGRAIPEIRMKIDRKQLGEGQSVQEHVVVELTGVHQPASFCLNCTHEMTERG